MKEVDITSRIHLSTAILTTQGLSVIELTKALLGQMRRMKLIKYMATLELLTHAQTIL